MPRVISILSALSAGCLLGWFLCGQSIKEAREMKVQRAVNCASAIADELAEISTGPDRDARYAEFRKKLFERLVKDMFPPS